MFYQLMMQKKGEPVKYCVDYLMAGGDKKRGVKPECWLGWMTDDEASKKHKSLLFNIIKFDSEKQAWYYFFRAKETRPEEYEGYYASVAEVLR